MLVTGDGDDLVPLALDDTGDIVETLGETAADVGRVVVMADQLDQVDVVQKVKPVEDIPLLFQILHQLTLHVVQLLSQGLQYLHALSLHAHFHSLLITVHPRKKLPEEFVTLLE